MGATPSGKQFRKTSKLQTAAIIIIAFTVVVATFYCLGVFDDFQALNSEPNPEQTQPALTAARKLEGHMENGVSRNILHQNRLRDLR